MDYRSVQNSEAWKERVSSEDRAMLCQLNNYRQQHGRYGHSPFASPTNVATSILPHICAPKTSGSNRFDLDRYQQQTTNQYQTGASYPTLIENGQPAQVNFMVESGRPRSPGAESVVSVRSSLSTASAKSGSSQQSTASSRASGTSVLSSQAMIEAQQRIERLEAMLREEKEERMQTQKELQILRKQLAQSLFTRKSVGK